MHYETREAMRFKNTVLEEKWDMGDKGSGLQQVWEGGGGQMPADVHSVFRISTCHSTGAQDPLRKMSSVCLASLESAAGDRK